MCLWYQGDDEGSESSDGIIELHSTESNEHVLINQADEAVSAYGNLQNLIHGLSGTIRQALSCYDLKLYVAFIASDIVMIVIFIGCTFQGHRWEYFVGYMVLKVTDSHLLGYKQD